MTTSTNPTDLWLVRPRRVAAPRLRVFCFPYAGGGPAAFRPWVRDLPHDVEIAIVQLPGRESRWRDPLHRGLDDIVPALGEAMRPLLSEPFVFFGHSLGAMIAFELSRWLRRQQLPMPQQLVCSAHRAPHLPNRHELLAHLPDDAFVRAVNERYGGVPAAILENRELLQLMLPSLRADVTVFESYRYREEMPLAIPLTALGGLTDTAVTQDEIEGWARHSSAGFRTRMFEGDHFFVQGQRSELLASLLGSFDSPSAGEQS